MQPTAGLRPRSLIFQHDRLYFHALLRINYTTYDVHRAQDVISPSTSHHNVMVLTNDDMTEQSGHRFAYARVLRVFHVKVLVVDSAGTVDYTPRRMDVLWVRWYKICDPDVNGWEAQKLDKVYFPPCDSEGAFGFLDPSDVLRASYIVPAYGEGKCNADGGEISDRAQSKEDWAQYYVMRYASESFVYSLLTYTSA